MEPSKDKTWVAVKDYIDSLGIFPSSFTSCVRTLVLNHETNLVKQRTGIDDVGKSLLLRLMYSPTLSSMLYYGTLTFKSEGLKEDKEVTPEELMGYYQPDEMAAMLSVIYVYRNLKRLSNSEEWGKYNRTLLASIELGGHLGRMIPSIGFARGLLVGAFPRLGLSAVLVGNLKGFKEYRSLMRSRKNVADFALEERLFGCTSVQLGSRMLQLFGFGKTVARGFYFGVSEHADDKEDPSVLLPYTVCNRWVSSLLETGEPPGADLGDEFEVSDEQLERNLPLLKSIIEDGSRYQWLERGKAELGGKVAVRELGGPVPIVKRTQERRALNSADQEPSKEKAAAGEDLEFNYDELPNEVKDQFQSGELEDLFSEIQVLLD